MRRLSGDAGGVALLILSGVVVALALGLRVLTLTADIGIAAARARTAADGAALAAMSAGCPAAVEVAEANGARVRRCLLGTTRAVGRAPPVPAVLVEVEVPPSGALAMAVAGPLAARAAAAARAEGTPALTRSTEYQQETCVTGGTPCASAVWPG